MINFPRPTKRVGKCLAIISSRTNKPVFRRNEFMFQNDIWKSNRLSYHLNKHKIPCTPKSLKRGLVLHTCDHDWCIDPKHLYLGTQKQNIKDMFDRHPTVRNNISKAQMGNQYALGHKLTKEVKQILAIKSTGNTNMLGKKHTDETKRKISKAQMGNKYSLGRILSIETKKRMSEAAKNRCNNVR